MFWDSPRWKKLEIYQTRLYCLDEKFETIIPSQDRQWVRCAGSHFNLKSVHRPRNRSGKWLIRADLGSSGRRQSLYRKYNWVKAESWEAQFGYVRNFASTHRWRLSFFTFHPEKANPNQILELTYFENENYDSNPKTGLLPSARPSWYPIFARGRFDGSWERRPIWLSGEFTEGMPVTLEGKSRNWHHFFKQFGG